MAIPDTRAVLPPCGSCGLPIRGARLRCPRCGELLDQSPVTRKPVVAARPIAAVDDGGSPWSTAAIGGAVAIVALLWVAWPSPENAPAPTVPPPETAAAPPATAGPSTGGVPDAGAVSAARARFASADDRNAGNAAYAQGDDEVAEGAYRAALQHDPGDLEARNNLAQVLTRSGRIAMAIDEYDLLVAADPSRWAFRFNRARAYSLLARWPEAIAEYKVAAGLFPQDYVTHYNLGLALARINEHAEAASTFERAVALAPGEPGFLVSLGTEYIALARYGEARTTFERYLAAAPDAPDAGRVREVVDGLGKAMAAGNPPPPSLPRSVAEAARRLSDR
jgi:Tfp pilus assembly protein PilF